MKVRSSKFKVQSYSSYEGLQKNIRNLKTPAIEVWKNQYPDKIYTINLEMPEFTCICPKTGLPDFATIKIEYSPAKYCVELKSFKLYTIFYRNIGIFHEHLVNKILEDFVKAVEPRWVKVNGIFNPRGGITTTVMREYNRDGSQLKAEVSPKKGQFTNDLRTVPERNENNISR